MALPSPIAPIAPIASVKEELIEPSQPQRAKSTSIQSVAVGATIAAVVFGGCAYVGIDVSIEA